MPKNKSLAKVLHFDSFGKRQEKYNRLENSSVNSVEWKELDLKEPYYFFVPKDFAAEERYKKGFQIVDIFKNFNSGVQTDRDPLFIQFTIDKITKVITKLLSGDLDEIFIEKYRVKDSSSFKLTSRIIGNDFHSRHIKKIVYRPFDIRYIYYDTKIISRPGFEVFKHFNKNNTALNICKQQSTSSFQHVFISNKLSERCTISSQTKEGNYVFPLYLYNTERETLLDEGIPERTPNFDMEVIAKIEKKLGMKLVASFLGEQRKELKIGIETFSPENLLDYTYAVLHSKSYRETYKEFLKIDFPRVPFDVTKQVFHNMVELGQELRSWHLLENEKLTPNNFITEYPQDGDNLVEKIRFEPLSFSKGQVKEGAKGLSGSGSGAEDSGVDSRKDNELGKVFINDTQYFGGVPETVWEFYIGGYQPAQKWLKDRKGRSLSYEDIVHYGKIILTLSETIRIMQEIEEVFEV